MHVYSIFAEFIFIGGGVKNFIFVSSYYTVFCLNGLLHVALTGDGENT